MPLLTSPCQGASETKLKTDKNCEPNEKGPKKISFKDRGGKKRDKNRNNINNSKDDSRKRSNKLHKHDLEARTCARSSDLRRKTASERARASETLEGRKQAFPKP
jgi:hypothetical protein